ncbi:Replication factor A protein 2 [Smittium culicis]|uniref:Replication factor A protein 2 n=1 Tax=Smittium culicis TaxID=133412 RepID=A0A1R1XQH5_9FUNG|nr:Replication factor A protein 2 [Smittium culicis]
MSNYNNDGMYSSQSNQYGGGFSQGGGDGSKKDNYSQQTMVPVTIKMLHGVDVSNPDKPFILDNHEVKNVMLIGVIRNINQQTTMTQYTLEDGTGTLDIKMWTTQSFDSDNLPNDEASNTAVSVGSYAKVCGDFRLFNNRIHVLAHSVKPLTDFNELSQFGLQAIYVHLSRTRGTNSLASKGFGGNSTVMEPSFNGSNSSVLKQVYEYINSFDSKMEGVSITEIERQLGPAITPQMIKDATYKLVDQGNIYTVMDDCHFISTHSGI